MTYGEPMVAVKQRNWASILFQGPQVCCSWNLEETHLLVFIRCRQRPFPHQLEQCVSHGVDAVPPGYSLGDDVSL